LITSELGKTDQFTVTLMTHPTESVSINLSSSDLSEGTVNPSSITFLPENWNVPQTVTVTGVNDPDIDLDINYSITLNPASSSDPLYDLRDPQDVSVVNLDDDSLKIFLPMVIK